MILNFDGFVKNLLLQQYRVALHIERTQLIKCMPRLFPAGHPFYRVMFSKAYESFYEAVDFNPPEADNG